MPKDARTETLQGPTEWWPRARFFVLALITLGTMINYMDRSVLGIVAPALSKDLKLGPAAMGLIFSAFSWTYAFSQIPGGALLDRLGPRLTYAGSLTCWSLVTLLHGLASGFAGLLGLRLALGVAEAPALPANSRIVNAWFPQHERARVTGVWQFGQYAGLAFLSPLLFWAVTAFGWRSFFLGVGVIGVLFGLFWSVVYRDRGRPDPRGQVQDAENLPFSFALLGKLLASRQILGASLGQFAGNCTLIFFLTWFPTYLTAERHMTFMKVGIYAVLPFIAGAAGVLAGGFLSDFILERTGSANWARKGPVVAGLLMAASIIFANAVHDDFIVVVMLSIALFGEGLVGLGWAVMTDIAPARAGGLAAGVFNFLNNTSGIITPLVIGLIVQTTGSFVGALVFVSVMALTGVFAYLVVLGDVVRVEVE